ncbi:MAG: AI-2E family transporter [Acidimicrobiales bacterium]|nr:AI-2E family transporter [Acidimicrobiales bacterium]
MTTFQNEVADEHASATGGIPGQTADVLILPAEVERDLNESDGSLGSLGRPFDRRNPFFVGMAGAFGVAVAYVVFRGIADITSVLVVVGLALFIAIGLNPIIDRLIARSLSRGAAVAIVTFGFVLIVGVFVVVATPPITHEFHVLVTSYPRYKADLIAGRGWAGRLMLKLHLTGYLNGKSKIELPVAGGMLGAGKALLSVGVATVSVVALTVYFLIALPGVKNLWLSLIVRSRRERVALLTDEVFDRVGGFMLGNLFTSLISAVGTYIWLVAFGVPYALLLALVVAVLDLIPMVGSTIAGVIVSLVALTKGLPVGIATAAFYITYRFLEDYLLNPRVMKHTVKVSPGLTIIATLVGGSLLGIIGALIAIPIAATIHLLLEEVAFPRQNRR